MPTILVVEDEPTIRELLVEVLEDEGYAVLGATNGIEALDVLAGQAPDLVLTDAMMPGLDGLGLVRRMRGDPRTASTPVILMSAVLRAGRPGFPGVSFLPKPFDLHRLLSEIEARLARADGPVPPRSP